MIEQIKTFMGNTLAIEVIDGFTTTDEKSVQKSFKEKVDEGFEQVPSVSGKVLRLQRYLIN
jgi:hypothetical protein